MTILCSWGIVQIVRDPLSSSMNSAPSLQLVLISGICFAAVPEPLSINLKPMAVALFLPVSLSRPRVPPQKKLSGLCSVPLAWWLLYFFWLGSVRIDRHFIMDCHDINCVCVMVANGWLSVVHHVKQHSVSQVGFLHFVPHLLHAS